MEDETIHDRIFGNWVIPLATFRTLETVLDVPFSYTGLFDTAVKGIRVQNELAQESSEVADFWNMLQGFQTMGKCVEKAHYRRESALPYPLPEEFPSVGCQGRNRVHGGPSHSLLEYGSRGLPVQ